LPSELITLQAKQLSHLWTVFWKPWIKTKW
jgi:hypothetical protein